MFSPMLHHIDNSIRWRAAHPTGPVPPPHDILLKYSQIPDELVERSKAQLKRLKEVAGVKPGEPTTL